MVTLHLSAGAGVGSSQKGILRVIGSGPRYADVMIRRARMPSRPPVCTGDVLMKTGANKSRKRLATEADSEARQRLSASERART
jgi:hypothetical protein